MSAGELVRGRRFGLIGWFSRTPVTVILAAGFMVSLLIIMVFAQFLQPYAFDHIDC